MPSTSPSVADNLNRRFGVSEFIKFERVEAGLAKCILANGSSRAEIHLQGAHVTSWKDPFGRENLFLSDKAEFRSDFPIRGGNPIIFPQFGSDKPDLITHGFARRSLWDVDLTKADNHSASLTLSLTNSDLAEQYQQQWPHKFEAKLKITLSLDGLSSELMVLNLDQHDIEFTAGFHTYFKVDDIEDVFVIGLNGLSYMRNLDKTHGIETRDHVKINETYDRRYEGIPTKTQIQEAKSGRKIEVTTQGCRDAFLWNPWSTLIEKFPDLSPESYKNFVCLEPGVMKEQQVIQPGAHYTMTQRIQRLDEPNS